jgi:feruloyl esterase
MRKTPDQFSIHRPNWDKMLQAVARMKGAGAQAGAARSHLHEVTDFGSNPGALRMFAHLPPRLAGGDALVVVLHGCSQSAADYDLGAGWSTLADRFGFCLLLPEQQAVNNPNRCFNWFQPGDNERGHGEAESIRQMIDRMVADHAIDPERIFITGLSAGGAMTSVMLAAYPDVFAGGAIVAGLPFGAANNVQQAFETMFQSPPRPASAWGDLVRAASSHQGPWPRISVWHGGVDATVIPSNAGEIIKQWTDIHGLPLAPSSKGVVDGYPRQVWVNDAGDEVIESYTITNMAHGTPLATGEADHECGAAGPFLLEVGISSSYHIAKFFRLTGAVQRKAPAPKQGVTPRPSQGRHIAPARAASRALDGEILGPEDAGPQRQQDRAHQADRAAPRFDVGAVINNALKAAGLMK